MTIRRIAEVAACARTHGGIVTTAQLVAAELDPRIAERQVRSGHWQRPARGVYVPHDRRLTGLDPGRVARRVAGQRVVVSGLVALRELELRWLPTSDKVLALVAADCARPATRTEEVRKSAIDHRRRHEGAPRRRAPGRRKIRRPRDRRSARPR